tara:strand:+ start:557 stop:1291 length:735 start_codon:yes stop_codon:yes gene_type:complete
MAGHSKWANIQHRKAAVDAKRGKAFAKVSREIMVAVKEGGADPNFNFSLRSAIERAKELNFPKEKIKSSIKAAQNSDSNSFEKIVYEAYAPGGIGILIEIMTDNKNRAAAEVRTVLNKKGGTLASSGAVSYLFQKCGIVKIFKEIKEEDVLDILINSGIEDYIEVETFENETIVTVPLNLTSQTNEALGKGSDSKTTTRIVFHPDTLIPNKEKQNSIIELLEQLEDLEDVNCVWTNLDIDEGAL